MQNPEKTQAERKNKISLTKATGWTMLGFGAAALVVRTRLQR